MRRNDGITLVLCERCQRLYPVREMARRGKSDWICQECDE